MAAVKEFQITGICDVKMMPLFIPILWQSLILQNSHFRLSFVWLGIVSYCRLIYDREEVVVNMLKIML